MSTITLDRIKSQIENNRIPTNLINIPKIEQILSPLLSAEKLSEFLKGVITKISKEKVIEVPKVVEHLKFDNLLDFVDWYEKVKDKFPEKQQVALNTLLEARNNIVPGCNCKRQQRQNAAFQYFRIFWDNNKLTDIPKSILEISGAKSLNIGNIVTLSTP
jgi:hypothetical protein